eukprot:TRINITY_DN2388_c0_g1_i3.p1 TRINITY_DN2388_c0_g1~~TRINITY_DN2388_c0_g1_i3.p1  ORF type:complete len:415 (-),score=76.07 TRINITY_DN2388_c0_g1_i3:3178-4422(-)
MLGFKHFVTNRQGSLCKSFVQSRKQPVRLVVKNVLFKDDVKPTNKSNSNIVELEKNLQRDNDSVIIQDQQISALQWNETIDLSTNLESKSLLETNLVEEEQGEDNADTNKFSGSIKGMVLLNIGALLFGSNQVAIKTTEEILAPSALSAIRFLIAALVFSPKIIRGLQKPELRLAAMELGCWLFGGYQAQAYGLAATTAARGAFTGTFTVLAVPILVGLSGRKIPLSTWGAAVVAIFGVGLLTTSGGDFSVGDAWCIASAILFGVHKFRTETITARFKEETQDLIAVQLMVLATLSSFFTIPLVANTLASGQTLQEIWTGVVDLPWIALVYMGLATTAFTLWIEMESLKEVSAPLAALIYTSEPLWGATFAWILLDERWGATGWVGAALIISSSLFCQLSGEQAEKVSNEKIAH